MAFGNVSVRGIFLATVNLGFSALAILAVEVFGSVLALVILVAGRRFAPACAVLSWLRFIAGVCCLWSAVFPRQQGIPADGYAAAEFIRSAIYE